MKFYGTWDVLSCFWNTYRSQISETVWEVLFFLDFWLDEMNINERFFENFESCSSRLVTDCIECYRQAPSDKNINIQYYSRYYGATTFKYFIISSLHIPYCYYFNGPYHGKDDDLTVTLKSGILENFFQKEVIISDQKYHGLSHLIVTLRDILFAYWNKFHFHRARVEHFNGYIKKFTSMSHFWRDKGKTSNMF